VAAGHREPGRSDLKEQIESVNAIRAKGNDAEVTLRPEKMLDTEIGYEYSSAGLTAGINLYSMEYRDMLLETGKISDSGYAIKENVDRSWRRGVELSLAAKPSSWLTLNGNLTLSTNKIKDYVFYEDQYDNSSDWVPVAQKKIEYGTVDMLMSPSVTGMAGFAIAAWKGGNLGMIAKYVGRQYWDNSQNEDRSIPAYYAVNASAEQAISLKKGRLALGLYVNNLLNRKYYADAWVYRAVFVNGDPEYVEEGLFPQAPINFSAKIRYEF
jgi:iron complex outermembrane receptor protein